MRTYCVLLFLTLFNSVGIVGTRSTSAALINFDDIPAGLIGDQYLSQGVRFYLGNSTFGTSTGLLLQNGLPVSALVGNYNTSVSQPNAMGPGPSPNGNEDVIVQFYDQIGQRTFASSVGITNDTDGNPSRIFIEGFSANSTSLGRTQIDGASQTGVFSAPNIYYAMIWSPSGQLGNIGVDNFTFTLVPEPASMILLGAGGAGLLICTRRRFWPRLRSGPDIWQPLFDSLPSVQLSLNHGANRRAFYGRYWKRECIKRQEKAD